MKWHSDVPRVPPPAAAGKPADPPSDPIDPIPRETTEALEAARRATAPDPDRYFLGRRGLLPALLVALLAVAAWGCRDRNELPHPPKPIEIILATARIVPPAELGPLFVEYFQKGEITQDQLLAVTAAMGWDCCLFPDVCGAAYCLPGCRKCGLPPVAPDGNEPEGRP